MYEIFFLKKYIFKRKYLVNFEKGEGPGRGHFPLRLSVLLPLVK